MTSATIVSHTLTGRKVVFRGVPIVFDEHGIAWAFAPGNTICHDVFNRPYDVFGERLLPDIRINGKEK